MQGMLCKVRRWCEEKSLWIEVIYLLSFSCIFLYAFYETIYNEPLTQMGVGVAIRTLSILALIPLMFIIIFYGRYSWWQFIVIALITVPILISVKCSGFSNLLKLWILLLASRRIPFSRVLKWFLIQSVVLIPATIFANQMGWIGALIAPDPCLIGFRHSFGFLSPTDFSAHFFFFYCAWCCYRRNKITWLEIGISIIPIFGFYAMDTKTSMICLGLLVVLLSAYKIFPKIWKKVSWIFIASMPVLGIGSIVLTYLYDPNSSFYVKLNEMFTGRLFLGKSGMDNFGLSFFGKQFVVTTQPIYNFIDSSYVLIALRFGFVIMTLVMVLWVLATYRAYRKNDMVILIVLSVIAVSCFMEHHLLDIAYNIPILYWFAGLDKEDGEDKEDREDKRMKVNERNVVDKNINRLTARSGENFSK